MDKTNLVVFPVVKQIDKKVPEDIDDITSSDIEKIVNHYFSQLELRLVYHGFDPHTNDLDHVKNFLAAAIKRQAGQYHEYQEVLDSLVEEEEEHENFDPD